MGTEQVFKQRDTGKDGGEDESEYKDLTGQIPDIDGIRSQMQRARTESRTKRLEIERQERKKREEERGCGCW